MGGVWVAAISTAHLITTMSHQTVPQPKCFTAAELAAALGISKRRVWKQIKQTPSRTVIVRGNETAAWSVDELPESIRARLGAAARNKGETIAELLENSNRAWQPPMAIGDVEENYVQAACKLREALLQSVQSVATATTPPSELWQRGEADYHRVFGHKISERHWRRLIDRTLRRDGGAMQLERLELYLHEKPARKSSPVLSVEDSEFQTLLDTICAFTDRATPTRREIAALWAESFQLYSPEPNVKAAKILRPMIAFLWCNAPAMGRSEHAVRVNFDRKFAKWEDSGRADAMLIDGRTQKRGEQRAEPIPQDDIDLLAWTAGHDYRGRVAPALRDLAASGRLSPSTMELIPDNCASKSYVNTRLSQETSLIARTVATRLKGKKAVDDDTPSIQRDYSSLRSMQVVTADDFTLNNYFYVPDGKGWYVLTRGQVLLMIDCRSLKIIGWSLQADRNYNAIIIRTLQNKVCRQWGLPRTWYFERGIWKTANLVKNAAPVHWRPASSWSETKIGWEEIGVRFRHATRARSKPAELVGGKLQNLLDGKPGYCGRDERRDIPEATKLAMQAVQARRAEPGEHFLSFEEWDVELGKAIERYNDEVQAGRIINRLSPSQAFEKFWPKDDPPIKFDASCWHLLAHYVSERLVKTDGICFSLGNSHYRYFNDRTSKDRGRRVLAWFDPELPDLLGVTDLNGKNPYLVERAGTIPFDAESDDPALKKELARAKAHDSYPQARFHVLKAKFAPNFRANLVDRNTAETAIEFQTKRQEIMDGQAEQRTRAQTVLRKAEKLGIHSALIRTSTPENLSAVEMIEAARRENELNESKDTQ